MNEAYTQVVGLVALSLPISIGSDHRAYSSYINNGSHNQAAM